MLSTPTNMLQYLEVDNAELVEKYFNNIPIHLEIGCPNLVSLRFFVFESKGSWKFLEKLFSHDCVFPYLQKLELRSINGILPFMLKLN